MSILAAVTSMSKFQLVLALLLLALGASSAQNGEIPGTMNVYNPSKYNAANYKACPGSGWNPNKEMTNGQAVFAGSSSKSTHIGKSLLWSCGATYNLTSDYNRSFGVKLVVKVVATCSSGCDTFQVSNSDFQSIAQRGIPPGNNLAITYVKA